MAKNERAIKADIPGKGSITQSETYEDNLLPSAEEMLRLKDIDPGCIAWILERAAKEQDHRHTFQMERVRLANKHEKREHHTDILSIFCAFIIIMGGMVFSYFLIEQEHVWFGSIFAGGTLLLAANSFLNFRKNNGNHKK